MQSEVRQRKIDGVYLGRKVSQKAFEKVTFKLYPRGTHLKKIQ